MSSNKMYFTALLGPFRFLMNVKKNFLFPLASFKQTGIEVPYLPQKQANTLILETLCIKP